MSSVTGSALAEPLPLPSPLAASIDITGAAGYFRTKMKMGQTSPVHVVVKSGGKLYSAKQEIKVTTGGCGG